MNFPFRLSAGHISYGSSSAVPWAWAHRLSGIHDTDFFTFISYSPYLFRLPRPGAAPRYRVSSCFYFLSSSSFIQLQKHSGVCACARQPVSLRLNPLRSPTSNASARLSSASLTPRSRNERHSLSKRDHSRLCSSQPLLVRRQSCGCGKPVYSLERPFVRITHLEKSFWQAVNHPGSTGSP